MYGKKSTIVICYWVTVDLKPQIYQKVLYLAVLLFYYLRKIYRDPTFFCLYNLFHMQISSDKNHDKAFFMPGLHMLCPSYNSTSQTSERHLLLLLLLSNTYLCVYIRIGVGACMTMACVLGQTTTFLTLFSLSTM